MLNYTISTEKKPEATELLHLFTQTSWAKNRTLKDTKALLENTSLFVVAKHKSKVVAFGRALTDGVYRALIDDVIVDESFRKSGLGTHIINTLLKKLHPVEEIFLNTAEHLETYYQKFGFTKAKCTTMKL